MILYLLSIISMAAQFDSNSQISLSYSFNKSFTLSCLPGSSACGTKNQKNISWFLERKN